MKKLLILVLFFAFFSLACNFSSISNTIKRITETSSIKIVSPVEGLKVTEPFVQGQTQSLPLSIDFQSNIDENRVVEVWFNGIGPLPCTLIPNKLNDCGRIALYGTGPQNIKVQLLKLSGKETITAENNFEWTPYSGLDLIAQKVASVVGSSDPTFGFTLMGLGFMLIFTLAISVLGKGSLASAVLGIFGGLFFLIALFIYYDASVAANLITSLYALVAATVFAVVIIYGMKNGYEIETPVYAQSITIGTNGRRDQKKIKTGFRLGKSREPLSNAMFAATEHIALSWGQNQDPPLVQIGGGSDGKPAYYLDGESIDD